MADHSDGGRGRLQATEVDALIVLEAEGLRSRCRGPRESPTFGGSRAALGCVRPVPASAPTRPSLPASVPAPLTPGHRPRGPVLPALGPTGLVVRFVTHHARGDAAPPRLRFRETRVDGGHPSTGPGVPEVGCVVGETEAGVCIFSGSSVGSDDCGLPASPLCEVQCPPAGGSQRSRLRAGDARGQEPKQLSGCHWSSEPAARGGLRP